MNVDQKPRSFLEEHKLKQAANDYGFDDEQWSFKKFKSDLKIVIVRMEALEMEFDMIGVRPAIANAFRRLMLSEVPTMAIEKVYIYNNTSIIQDEVLAHRLGLIPLRADPRLFEYKSEESDEGTERDTLEFELKVKCTKKTSNQNDSIRFEDLYNNHNVYSGMIKWIPKGSQNTIYSAEDVGPVENDILISKMRPGHEIDLKLLAVKGVGKDHAKFSPVATAFYRLLPEIYLTRPVLNDEAQLLQKCFSPGVIEIHKTEDGNKAAFVKDARYDTCSRNVYRYPNLADAVIMSRVRDHYIFNIESAGALRPEVIFIEAVRVLKNKCRLFIEELDRV
ncbi:DNA-directed RNA polymerases I and III subunit RPAC1-like [Ctenocephalides felis]|uniref:DNA-directed RNA polymerases I and III subunit RPAC1-like n=1 Tax=Ctenocephalides felis TaxID=7515 RepID=UPI000E6E5691|nr:DNA-directed RNA polymerases I and III subunit RPAC1-like [Ctenocephalides felis]